MNGAGSAAPLVWLDCQNILPESSSRLKSALSTFNTLRSLLVHPKDRTLLRGTETWVRVHHVYLSSFELCCPCSSFMCVCVCLLVGTACTVNTLRATGNRSQFSCLLEHILANKADSDSDSWLLHITCSFAVRKL